MEILDDHSLMTKVKEGQVEKLSLLYERYKLKLFGFFYKMTSESSTSEDLVQNVFVRVLKYRKTYHENGNFKTWIFHIARNVSYDHFRKIKKYHFEEDMSKWDHQLVDEKNAEIDLAKKGDLSKLQLALNKLGHEKRELIHLAKIEGLKYEDIAEVVGCSVGTLKVRIHRALADLKKNFQSLNEV